jgi:hypothetical protein
MLHRVAPMRIQPLPRQPSGSQNAPAVTAESWRRHSVDVDAQPYRGRATRACQRNAVVGSPGILAGSGAYGWPSAFIPPGGYV